MIGGIRSPLKSVQCLGQANHEFAPQVFKHRHRGSRQSGGESAPLRWTPVDTPQPNDAPGRFTDIPLAGAPWAWLVRERPQRTKLTLTVSDATVRPALSARQ